MTESEKLHHKANIATYVLQIPLWWYLIFYILTAINANWFVWCIFIAYVPTVIAINTTHLIAAKKGRDEKELNKRN